MIDSVPLVVAITGYWLGTYALGLFGFLPEKYRNVLLFWGAIAFVLAAAGIVPTVREYWYHAAGAWLLLGLCPLFVAYSVVVKAGSVPFERDIPGIVSTAFKGVSILCASFAFFLAAQLPGRLGIFWGERLPSPDYDGLGAVLLSFFGISAFCASVLAEWVSRFFRKKP